MIWYKEGRPISNTVSQIHNKLAIKLRANQIVGAVARNNNLENCSKVTSNECKLVKTYTNMQS